MAKPFPIISTVPVDRIFLDLENPRHEPYGSQAEVIDYLFKEENVFSLAKDIAKWGLNPMELFALLPSGTGKKDAQSYVVAEGNRRMCAVLLLHDPELAPKKYRKEFRSLNKGTQLIAEVNGVIFDDREAVKMWLERIHGGEQGGIGRRHWDATQKARNTGDKKNIPALLVLDYAEKNGLLTPAERKQKLTTVQRYLSNAAMREAIGIDISNPNGIVWNRPKPGRDKLLKKFMRDLVEGTVSSRSNATDILQYSQVIASIEEIPGKLIAPEPLTQIQSAKGTPIRRTTPPNLTAPITVRYHHEIREKLEAIPSYKLQSLYHSLCKIELENHTPLISIGVWAFFETLTARIGRVSITNFPSFLNPNKLQQLGFNNRDENKAIKQALERISEYGNITKHDKEAAFFNGTQLHNDMEILRSLIIKLAVEACESKK